MANPKQQHQSEKKRNPEKNSFRNYYTMNASTEFEWNINRFSYNVQCCWSGRASNDRGNTVDMHKKNYDNPITKENFKTTSMLQCINSDAERLIYALKFSYIFIFVFDFFFHLFLQFDLKNHLLVADLILH